MNEEKIKRMVDRFLSWKLPEDFNPDGGISFKREFNENTPFPMKHEPTGTNLLDATQAKAMLEYVAQDELSPEPPPAEPPTEPPTFSLIELSVLKEAVEFWTKGEDVNSLPHVLSVMQKLGVGSRPSKPPAEPPTWPEIPSYLKKIRTLGWR